MESYGEFAEVYDRLMDDFDYPSWAEYYLRIIGETGVKPRRVIDCACGTGSMSVEFARRGMEVTGVDISAAMLERASVKARKNAQKIVFVRQDITQLKIGRPADAVVCACDGVNYLADSEGTGRFFRAAFDSLKSGGCLAFDISSRWKLENTIGDGFFGEERDDVAYLWSNTVDREKHLIDMDLTFFVRVGGEDDMYRRFTERHRQRAHDVPEIVRALTESGFSDIKVYGGMTMEPPSETEQRIHFTAVKR